MGLQPDRARSWRGEMHPSSPAIALAFLCACFSGRVRAEPGAEVIYWSSFLSSRHRPPSDTDVSGNQGFLGLGIESRLLRANPVFLGASAFVARSHGDSPQFTQLDLGFELGVDVGRTSGIGVGFRVRPVFSWWFSDVGETQTDPGLGSVIEELPQMKLLVGTSRSWLELAAGGAAHGLDPRVGHISFNWHDQSAHRFSLGAAVISGPYIGDGFADTELVSLGATATWWHPLTETIGLEAACEIGTPLIVGVRVGISQRFGK